MAWLTKKYTIIVLPSAGALRALRLYAKPTRAVFPFVGFGDPALKSTKSDRRGLLIKEKVPIVTDTSSSDDKSVDITDISQIPELKETAVELRAIAHFLGAGEGALYFRERATKKQLRSVDLSAYRIVAFSTHGLISGELQGLTEPALVLSPVKEENIIIDNGLLTATEIANIKLDADWVVLSACNTASSSGRPGAEGLSGLARAFFYAGSRTLLVSHWAVDSDATVKLITGIFKSFSKSDKITKAKALQQSMIALMESKEIPYYAHPIYWAPFIIVGEGSSVVQ